MHIHKCSRLKKAVFSDNWHLPFLQTACETWGGYIVVIETAEENNFIKEVARKIDQSL